MKNIFKITAVIILLSLICSVSVTYADDATVKSYEDQLDLLSQKQKDALSRLNATESDLAGAIERKNILDDYLEATMQKIVVAESMLKEIEQTIAEKEEAVKKAQSDIEERHTAFLNRMVYMEEDGTASLIEILFDSVSLGDFFRKLDSVNSIMEYDRYVIDSLNDAKEQLEKYKTALETVKAEQSETLSLLEKEKADFEVLAAESAATVAELQANAALLRDEYNKASKEEKELAAELEAYLKELEAQKLTHPDSPDIPQASADFIPPLDPACGAYISSSYGWRDLFGVPDLHEATDIPATAGTPIYASNSGVVIKSENHYSYGNYIMIDHGNGIYTLYAHMTYREYSVGQSVNKGDVIGYVGNTGNSYGAHLHFEYWVNGKRTDPEAYVSLPYPKW